MPDLQTLVGSGRYSRSQVMAITAQSLSRFMTAEGVKLSDSLTAGDTPLWMEVTFNWDAVGGADSYQLEIGTTTGGTEYAVLNVGNVLTYVYNLPPGTYYTRVKAVTGGTPGTASTEQVIYV